MARIAIVGRPNVGKSSLFNRILGRREAVVEERPKVTRDTKEAVVTWRGVELTIVDTGGYLANADGLDHAVSTMVETTIRRSDAVVCVVDARVPPTVEDEAIARIVARQGVPHLLVANKVDAPSHEPGMWEHVALGLGEPLAVSAVHGRGVAELLDALLVLLGLENAEERPRVEQVVREPDLAVAIVGRPNVGKSSLFNRLVGESRSIVYDQPGTTVDTVDTVVATEQGTVRFVDTAGLRRRSRFESGTEYFSMVRTLAAIDAADVVVLVIDATEGVTGWDQRLVERIDAAGSPVILVLNKWDLLDAEQKARVERDVEDRLAFVTGSAPLRVSALTGRGVHRLLPAILEARADYEHRIPTATLNRFLAEVQAQNPAPGARVLYAVQGSTRPPTITLFTTRALAPTYLRFLERRIQQAFGLEATPIKLRLRRRGA